MSVPLLIALFVVIALFILATLNIGWPRFHPGWGGLLLLSVLLFFRVLGLV